MQDKVKAIRRLLEIIDTLRGPDGCPWDRAQTLETMGRYLLEESSEAVDAIEDAGGKPEDAVRDELGDVLMNVFLCARIAEDEGGFDIESVAGGIAEKLVRRHPHVFGKTAVRGVDDVLANWEAIKAQERQELQEAAPGDGPQADEPRASRLDGVPRSLPALDRAHQLSRKAAKVGFDWPDATGALDKVLEETAEVKELLDGEADISAGDGRRKLEAELGDLLFAAANLCRKLGISPSTALRRTLSKFCDRFRAIEKHFPDLENTSLEEMEAVWQQAKGRPAASGDSAEPGNSKGHP